MQQSQSWKALVCTLMRSQMNCTPKSLEEFFKNWWVPEPYYMTHWFWICGNGAHCPANFPTALKTDLPDHYLAAYFYSPCHCVSAKIVWNFHWSQISSCFQSVTNASKHSNSLALQTFFMSLVWSQIAYIIYHARYPAMAMEITDLSNQVSVLPVWSQKLDSLAKLFVAGNAHTKELYPVDDLHNSRWNVLFFASISKLISIYFSHADNTTRGKKVSKPQGRRTKHNDYMIIMEPINQ